MALPSYERSDTQLQGGNQAEVTGGVLRAVDVGRCGKLKNFALRFRVADSLEHRFLLVRTYRSILFGEIRMPHDSHFNRARL
jgi:hypothetical protein